MTPPDDPLALVPRDLTAFNITIPKYPNSASCFTCGRNCSQRSSSKEGSQTSTSDCTSDAVASLQTNSLESLDGKTFRMSKGTAWCVIFTMRSRSKMIWPKT